MCFDGKSPSKTDEYGARSDSVPDDPSWDRNALESHDRSALVVYRTGRWKQNTSSSWMIGSQPALSSNSSQRIEHTVSKIFYPAGLPRSHMSTADRRTHPFENPLVRYGIGLSGAIVIIAIALAYLEGVAFYAALAVAVVDAVATPKVLEYAVENDGSDDAAVQT